MTTVLTGPDEVYAAVGSDLATTEWITVTAEQVELYRQCTGDDAEGIPPFLVLSLSNLFMPLMVRVDGFSSGVNAGVDAVRFLAAAPVGARLRGCAKLVEASEVKGSVQTLIRITIELEGSDEPACVIDSLSRWFP